MHNNHSKRTTLGVFTSAVIALLSAGGTGGFVLACGDGSKSNTPTSTLPPQVAHGALPGTPPPNAGSNTSSGLGAPGAAAPPSGSNNNNTSSSSSGGTPGGGTFCNVETHAVVLLDGRPIDTMTTGDGKLYNFEGDYTAWPSNGADLTSVDYYAAGPCAGKSKGACHFDTRTFVRVDGRLLEYITVQGKNWTFANGVATDRGSDLASNARYSDACASRQGSECMFDTRVFVEVEGRVIESITAYGKIFEYALRDGTRGAVNGQDLTTISKYAQGPCRNQPLGQCRLDTRAYGVAGSQVVEILAAYGSVWRYDAAFGDGTTAIEPNGVSISVQAPWNKGLCR